MTLVNAEYIKEYKLLLTFSNNKQKQVDFEPVIRKHAMYKPYLNIDKFKKFKVEWNALRWPGNRLDFHYTQLLKM